MTSDTPTGGHRLPIVPRASTSTTMSAYFQSLDVVARVRYQEKFTLLGFSVSEDPYELWSKEKFVQCTCMSLWPPVEYGHIFCYFVERPGIFTKKELMNWKILDAYNYFQSAHVRLVKVFKARSYSTLMALVNLATARLLHEIAENMVVHNWRPQRHALHKLFLAPKFKRIHRHRETKQSQLFLVSNTGNRIQALKIHAHGSTASRSSRHYRQTMPTSRRARRHFASHLP